METMKLRTTIVVAQASHIGADGILQIEAPTNLKDTSVEVVVVVQPLPNAEVAPPEEDEVRYNTWGKATTKKSIQEAITRMRQLQREVALNKTSIRSMIEEGRR